jgi:anti-sigma factor RsiW
MTCPIESRETEVLMAYSSGKLDAERNPALAGHLENCHACRDFVKTQRAVWDTLDVWQAAPVSAEFDRRLYQRIDEQVSWFDRLLRPLHWGGFRQAFPIAASAGLVLMAGLLLQHSSVTPAVQQQNTAQMEALQPEQLELALDEMEALSQLSRPVHTDSADSKM